MELLLELKILAMDLLEIALGYISPYSLEIIVLLFVATFMLGFVSATK